MTSERLAEVRERANLQCGLDGDDADDLLIHVDHLTAEKARLRERIEALRKGIAFERDDHGLGLEKCMTELLARDDERAES